MCVKLFWYKVLVHLKLKCLDFPLHFVLISFAFEKTPRISLSCKLVPVQYRGYEYGLILYYIIILYTNIILYFKDTEYEPVRWRHDWHNLV